MAQEKLPPSFKPNEDVEPLPESFQPEMNFAVVNKKYVEPDKPDSLATRAKTTWDAANEPLINVTPEMKSAMDSFSVDHPVIGGTGQFLTDALLSMSSPLSLGLGALTGGASLAEKFGLESLASALHMPGKAAAGGMIGHGLYKIGEGDTAAEKVGGGLEAVLGGLGLRGGGKPNISELPRINELAPHELPKIDLGPDFAPIDTPVAESGISRGKPIEQLQFELARNKFNMARDLPLVNGESTIIDTSRFNKSEPMLVNGKPNMANFGGMRDNSNFTEGSGGLTDISAGKFTRHSMPNIHQKAVFQGWQPAVGDLPEQALYNVKGAHPNGLNGSTVTAQTLKNEGIAIPETPPYKGEHATIGGMPESFAKHVQPRAKDKLIAALENSRAATKEQTGLNSAERARRIAQFSSHNINSEGTFDTAMGELSGKYPKAKFDPIKLDQSDVDSLFQEASARLTGYEMPRAGIALKKLLGGEALQPNEHALLKRAFGDQFADALRKSRPLKAQSLITQVVNIPKAIMTWLPFDAAFRQGSGMVLRKEFWTSLDDLFKSFGSEKFTQALNEGIRASEHFELGQESGLALTSLAEGLGQREEAFMSQMLDKLPLMKASARSYTAFLNKLRSDSFNSLIDNATKAGIDPYKDVNFARNIAQYVNNATGRGSLGSLEKVAVELNNAFFSPRLISSRVSMLNPNSYIQIGKGLAPKQAQFMRMQYLRSALGYAGFAGLAVGIGKMAGGTVSSDRNSSDFGKLKIGNTRLDPYGGQQQYVVALNQLQSGEKDTANGNKQVFGKFGMPTRATNLIDFTANRLAPVPKFVYDILNQSKGRPFDVSQQVADMFTPMLVNDIYELAKEDPKLLPLAIPDIMGMNVDTYGKGIKKSNALIDLGKFATGQN